MKKNNLLFLLRTLLLLSFLLVSGKHGLAQTAYVANHNSNNLSIINVTADTVITTISVGNGPSGVSASPDGTKVYVANRLSDNVSVINTATNTVIATIPVGDDPRGVSVSPDGRKVYVTNFGSDDVSVINTITNTVSTTIPVGIAPWGVSVSLDGTKVYSVNNHNTVSVINTATNTVIATVPVGQVPINSSITPDGKKIYVTNNSDFSASVINTVTNTTIATIPVGNGPRGVSVSPDGTKVYIANFNSASVSVINTAADTVSTSISAGNGPTGVSVSPDGMKVYITNEYSNSVSVINTTTNTVIATIPVGSVPRSLGNFISSYPVAFVGPQDICVGAGAQMGLGGGVPAGGVYSGPGVTDDGNGATYTFDPTAAGPGAHIITYSYSGLNAKAGIVVYPAPIVTLTLPDTFYMTQDMPQTGIGGGSPVGGVYTDAFGEIDDDDNGMTFSFNSDVLVGDTNLITYAYTDANGCVGTASKQVFVAAPTSGVSSLSDLQVNIFPNPTTGVVELRGVAPQTIKVMDQLGRLVLAQESPQPRIDLSRLPIGVYTLLVHLGNGQWASGIVVRE